MIARRNFALSACAAALASGGRSAPSPPPLVPAIPIVIAVAPYVSLQELSTAPYPLDGEPAIEARRSAHTALYAAQELRHYLCRLLGIEPAEARAFRISARTPGMQPRGIHLVDLSTGGAARAARALGVERACDRLRSPDSFALAPCAAGLCLAGHSRAGLLYAAYHFLEMQGVRWYAPGGMGEVVPAVRRIVVPPEAVVSEPAFLTRGFFAWEPRGDRDFHVWMARNRLNYWTIAGADHAFLGKAGLRLSAGSHWILPELLNPAAEYPFRVPGFPGEGKPPDPYPPAAAQIADSDGDGKLSYFEARPEWYGFYEGKRTPFEDIRGVNICSSNPGVMAELCRKIVDEFARGRWKNVDILEFWALDSGRWCRCSACEALGTPTDRLLLMVHQVRQAIARALREGALGRDVRIFFPIYEETLPAPTRPLPEGFDYQACIGTLFPIGRCYGHTMDDASCTETNVPIWRTILGWRQGQRFYRGEFVMGEYYNISSTKSLPVPYTRIMAADIPMYQSHGVRHFHFMHACTRLLGPKRLNQYLLARLLWDPGADAAALVNRYCDDFYGGAALPMREFYKALERAMSAITQWKSGRFRLTARLAKDAEPLFPLEHLRLAESHPPANDGVDLEESLAGLRRCRAILDRALADAGGGVVRERLLEDERNLRYAEHTVNLYHCAALALAARRAGNLSQAREYYRAGLPHARGLEAEVEIVQSSSSHANAKNGLDASQIEAAWRALGGQLGVAEQ